MYLIKIKNMPVVPGCLQSVGSSILIVIVEKVVERCGVLFQRAENMLSPNSTVTFHFPISLPFSISVFFITFYQYALFG